MSSSTYHRSPRREDAARWYRDHPRPVWVALAHAFGTPTSPRAQVGYQLAREVRGELYRWIRTKAGWFGLVEMDMSDWQFGRVRQLVPDRALRERDDNRTLNGAIRR